MLRGVNVLQYLTLAALRQITEFNLVKKAEHNFVLYFGVRNNISFNCSKEVAFYIFIFVTFAHFFLYLMCL